MPRVSPPPPRGYHRQAALLAVNLRQVLSLAWRAEPALVGQYTLVSVLAASLPVGVAWVGRLIVDHAVAALALPRPRSPDATLSWVAVELVLVLALHASGQWLGYISTLLRARMGVHVDALIFAKSLRLSLRHFEDADFMDVLERARKESGWRPVEMITHGLGLARNAVTLVGYAALLVQFSWWAVGALALAGLPFLAETRYGAEQYRIKAGRTADERQASYLQQLLCSDYHAKEVRLFALGPLLVERYKGLHEKFYQVDRAFAARRGTAVTVLGAVSAGVFYGVYAWVVVRAVSGGITLGAMTLYLTVFRQGQGAFQGALNSLARAYEDNLYMNNLFELLAIPDDDVAMESLPEGSHRATAPTIRFEGVSFGYPGSQRAALEAVDLEIRAGETVALVGPNGAGKSTLVKLLAGLYAPSAGKITLDGEDTAGMDRGALRARIGVVFQDFVHYHFTAADNVGIGWLPSLGDREAIAQAAVEGGAAEVLTSLPQGYDTMLGRWFGGEQLSVGQWQRVALARAFMRRSGILILDEPTAAIDAEGEHEVFERFQALKAGRTAVLITHRFSTVRMADRIVVLEGGRIAETGSHGELMAAGGVYARMFSLQAKGYTAAG